MELARATAELETPEGLRGRRAQAMFEFLVSHWVRQGCRDWDGLTQEARDAFIDTVALHVEGFRAAELEG